MKKSKKKLLSNNHKVPFSWTIWEKAVTRKFQHERLVHGKNIKGTKKRQKIYL